MTRVESWWSTVQEMCQLYNLAPPFDPEDFCTAYNGVERYPIILQPQPMSEGRHISGICRFDGQAFYAFYSTAGSRLLQLRTKWHEIGHVVLGHVGPGNPDVLLTHGAFMTTLQENEAEDFAALMTVFARLGSDHLILPRQHLAEPWSGRASFDEVVNGILRREYREAT